MKSFMTTCLLCATFAIAQGAMAALYFERAHLSEKEKQAQEQQQAENEKPRESDQEAPKEKFKLSDWIQIGAQPKNK
jgi:cell division protein FtsL